MTINIDMDMTIDEPSEIDMAVTQDVDNISFELGAEAIAIKNHAVLENRDRADQHPISAITGLANILSTIPTKTSQLTNDSGYITSSAIPTVPTKTSDLTNDSGYITSADIPSVPVKSVNGKTGAVVLGANDVGALPSSTTIPTKTSELTNDSGFLTSFAETDPTVPSWAKASTKPTYTASEVGALPNTTVIPTKTSELTNDSGYITSVPVTSVNSKTGAVVLSASDVGALPNTTTYAESSTVGGSASNTEGIPYGEVDSTSTATVFTATVPGITELKDGTLVFLRNAVVTSASGFTININGLGAKPVYNSMATGATPSRDTTIFNVAYTMLFVYSTTIVSGGGWICYRGYDANTNTIGYQLRTNSMSLPVSGACYRYRICFTSADGSHFVPSNTSSSTNATASRTVNQSPIDPFGRIVYYNYTTAVSSGSRLGATYITDQIVCALGYSFNRTGEALTLTPWKPVYVMAEPQADGSAIINATTPYVQELPTTADGNIYIFLGVAYSATNIELQINHSVYYIDTNGRKRIWTGEDIAVV